MSKKHEESGDWGWVKVVEAEPNEQRNRVDVFIGARDEKGTHCHYWIDSSGKSHMVHRGACDECQSGGK